MYEIYADPTPVKKEFDFLYFLLSIIVAGVAGFAALWQYWSIHTDLYLPLRVGISFFSFAFLFVLLMLIISLIGGRFNENVFNGKLRISTIFLPLAGICLAAAVVGGLFQWLYLQNFSAKPKGANAYVFLVDNSSSMTGSDPDFSRYDAIDSLVSSKGDAFPYMVYVFNKNDSGPYELGLIREMASTREQTSYARPENMGGTAIFKTLNQAMDEYDAGKWGNAKNIQVILVTDANDEGESLSQTEKNNTYARFTAAGIPVCTVYVQTGASNVNHYSGLMDIADGTGGKYAVAENIEGIADALSAASDITYDRSLMENRGQPSVYHFIIRILAFALLGILVGLGGLTAYGRNEAGKICLVVTLFKSFLVAVLAEVLPEMLPSHPSIVMLIAFILMGMLILMMDVKLQTTTNNTNHFEQTAGSSISASNNWD